MKKVLSILMALFMVLSLVYVGAPASFAADDAAPETRAAAALPANVDLYVPFVEGSMSSVVAQIQVDWWAKQFPGTTFNLIFGGSELIDQFAALGATDGSALLFDTAGDIKSYYEGVVSSDLSDRTKFTVVTSSPGSLIPSGGLLVCRTGEDRFNSVETLISYIKAHPGEIIVPEIAGSLYDILMRNFLAVSGVDASEVTFAACSNSSARAGIQSGTIDILMLNDSVAENMVTGGNVKGILHAALTREGYAEAFADVPIISEISIYDESDYGMLLLEMPFMIFACAGTDPGICSLLNTANDGIMDDEEFSARVIGLGTGQGYQQFTMEELDAMLQKSAEQIRIAYFYGVDLGPYPIFINWTDEETWIATRIQVSADNMNDVLGDGGSIVYDPVSQALTFNNVTFPSGGTYISEDEAALYIGDTHVTLRGSAYIPTVYSDSPSSLIEFDGDFRIGSMEGALSSSGSIGVIGGKLTVGASGTPLYARYIGVVGGTLEATCQNGQALYATGNIDIFSGSVKAQTMMPNFPAIYAEGSVNINYDTKLVDASIFSLSGQDISEYENDPTLNYRIVGENGVFIGEDLQILQPEGGKVTDLSFENEHGAPRTFSAVTKADGSASARVVITPQLNGLAEITKCKLELAGKISIRLYFKAPENAKTAKIFYEDVNTHTFPETAAVTISLARTGNPNYSASQDMFIMTFPKITSREMTRDIKFVVYDENDQPMWLYYDENGEYYTDGFEYCAADWANKILNKESTAEAYTMAQALLNYGGCAQVYLNNFNPDKPANPYGYMAYEMETLEPDPANDMEVPDKAYDIGFDRAKLALEADTTVRLYFNNPVKVYVDGVEKKVYSSGGTYLAMIEGISSRNISKKYVITVTSPDGSQSAEIKYSVLSWANKQIADNNPNSTPTAKALYLYNQAALAYIK